MESHLTITSWVLFAVLLCTIHLLLGVWVGSVFKASRGQFADWDSNPALAKACSELQARARDTAAVNDQASRLFQLCTQYLPALPPEVVAASDRLAKSTSALRAGIESVNQLFLRRRQPVNKTTTAAASKAGSRQARRKESGRKSHRSPVGNRQHASSNNGEPRFSLSHEELRTMADSASTTETPVRTDRYEYDVFQQIAPFRDELPHSDLFAEVRCRDLSRGGFSFFQEEVPDFETLIVALGIAPELKFLVAHIEHHRPIEIEGKLGYLIGCRFVQLLTDAYFWDETCGRFILTVDSHVGLAG